LSSAYVRVFGGSSRKANPDQPEVFVTAVPDTVESIPTARSPARVVVTLALGEVPDPESNDPIRSIGAGALNS